MTAVYGDCEVCRGCGTLAREGKVFDCTACNGKGMVRFEDCRQKSQGLPDGFTEYDEG